MIDTLKAARRMSVVTTRQGDGAHPEVVRALAADSPGLARLAAMLAGAAQARGVRGLVFDLEGHDASDLAALIAVTAAIADSARARGIDTIVMVVPAGDTLAYPARPFLRAADLILVTLYGEHWAGSAPGPIASPAWVRRHLDQRIAEVGADRLVAALPAFGYQWWGDSATILVSHDDAQRLALAAGVGMDREPSSRWLRAIRPSAWEMWVADAELLRHLIAGVRETGVRRIALWRLGLEDAGVWEALGR
jgi:spore germination protein YaaH